MKTSDIQTPDSSAAAQARRREAHFACHRDALDDVDGVTHDSVRRSPRMRLMQATPWMADLQADFGQVERFVVGEGEWAPCHFAPAVSMQWLMRWGERMPASLRDFLEDYVRGALDRQAASAFRGRNDNFPAMAACSLALAGTYFDTPERSREAVAVLESARALLRRRDYLSEYLSPSYSGITLAMFAEVADNGGEATVRERAASLEQRLWGELLSHWHAAAGTLAGPHSRAYERDSVAHPNLVHAAMHQTFGAEVVPLNHADFFYPARPGVVLHHDIDFARTEGVWLALPTYHPPEDAVRYLCDPGLPRTEVGQVESSHFRDVNTTASPPAPDVFAPPYPASVARVVTYLSPGFALGTASRKFLDGDQNDHFSLKIARPDRTIPPRVVFSRYVSGRKTPGEANHYPDLGIEHPHMLLADEGRAYSIQRENLALVASWPKRRLGQAPTEKLALDLLIPLHFSRPDELWLGDARVGDATVETADPAPLFIREGDVFAAFFPLSVSDSGRECATRAEIRGSYQVVEYINYEGEAKAFSAPELTAISNGFAVLVEEGDGRDFADWRQKIALRVSDEPGKYVASERRVNVAEASGTELELLLEPQTESVRHATIDGHAVE